MRWLVGAWLFCLMGYILTGCMNPPPVEVYYGKTYKVKNGFYKNCTGETRDIVGDQVLFSSLICQLSETTTNKIYNVWINKKDLE